MFVRIRNTPLDYAWGAPGAITGLLGDEYACETRADSGPEAELWLGAHDGSPSRIIDPEQTGGAADLRTWIEADPHTTLGLLAGGLRDGDGARLPFLMKVLAAGAPLSLQVHPSLEHAREGFARENELGLPLRAPLRSYRDPSHKPELLLALSDTVEALAGFRRSADVVPALERFADAAADEYDRRTLTVLRERIEGIETATQRRELVAWLLSRDTEALAATTAVTAAACALVEPGVVGVDLSPTSAIARDAATVRMLAARYPGDPGIVIALLLHRITLQRGEALYVGAGTMHAYLRGVGLEIMASSDNVLRGGLTPKHVDVPELLRVVDTNALPPPYLAPIELAGGVREYRPAVTDFRLVRATRDAESGDASSVDVYGPAIVLCLAGEARVRGQVSSMRMRAGMAAYVTPDEGNLEIGGICDVIVGAVGIDDADDLPDTA